MILIEFIVELALNVIWACIVEFVKTKFKKPKKKYSVKQKIVRKQSSLKTFQKGHG